MLLHPSIIENLIIKILQYSTDLLPEIHPPGSQTSPSLCCLQCPAQKSSDTPETLGKETWLQMC